MEVMNSQTLTFRDGTNQWKSEAASASDYTRYMTPNSDVPLSDFLERPTLIATYSWTPGVTPFYQTFNPWTLFLGNKRNINRINNFALLNCKLNVKILINGNPFYYGRLMADYQPLHTLDAVSNVTGLSILPVIAASQRLHTYIDPATSQAGTLVLPFVWYNNAISIPAQEWTSLGRMFIRQMQPLKHANGSVTPVTINVFAWASDVVLSIPTSLNSAALIAQASEIDMRPSTVASAAASVASKLTSVPIIGPYAKATSMVMSTLGVVAKIFGYSRPCVIDEPSAMRPTLIGELACVDKKENVCKLTADSRQELTIDPRVVGVEMPDELTVNYIASKESYLTQFDWTIAAVEGTHLWNVRVNPLMLDYNSPNYYATSLACAAMPFKSWRGTLKYRIQIVASAYHKGRLLILYDPYYINANLETNTMYSRIIDLEKERDVTIDVAWANPAAYLSVPTLTGVTYFSTTPYATTDLTQSNGVLGIYVLNSLTSPNSTINNDISVNVFVSACEDIDFVEPTSLTIRNIAWTSQSNEIDMENAPTSQESDECMSKCVEVPDIHSVFYGERFNSFRALMKRYVLHSSFMSPSSAAGRYTWQLYLSDYPASRGVVASNGFNNTGLANYVNTSLVTYFTPCFLTQRGGVRYKYVLHEDTYPTASTLMVVRGQNSGYFNAMNARQDATSDAYMKFSSISPQRTLLNAGAVTVSQLQPSLEVELPYYQTYRFSAAKDPNNKFGLGPTASNHVLTCDTKVTATTDRIICDRYLSVAEDFQLSWFQGMPPFYLYTVP